MHALDIDAPGVREEHQVIMRAGGEQVLDEVLVLFGGAFARGHADNPFAAAALGAIGADVRPLDQAGVGEGDDDPLVRDQVLDGDLAFVGHQIRHARRGVLLFDRQQLGLDDGQHPRFLRQDIEQVLDPLDQGRDTRP